MGIFLDDGFSSKGGMGCGDDLSLPLSYSSPLFFAEREEKGREKGVRLGICIIGVRKDYACMCRREYFLVEKGGDGN